MGLKDFQHACLELALRQDSRQALARGELLFVGLSKREQEALKALGADYFENIAQEHQQLQIQNLKQHIPYSVMKLLGPALLEEVLTQVQASDKLPHPYSATEQITHFLNSVQAYLAQENLIIPHLWDAIHYEQAAARLYFFRLPNTDGQWAGPVLAHSARIMELGPHFPEVLKQLRQGLLGSDYSETPKQSFLMLRDFQGLILEPISQVLAQCLQACEGQRSWTEISREVLQQAEQEGLEAEALKAEAKVLEQAYPHYLKRGILWDKR